MRKFGLRGKYSIADKEYARVRFVRRLEEHGAIAVIPSRKTAKRPYGVDRHVYIKRRFTENRFLKFKSYHRFAARYEKRVCLFLRLPLLPPSSFGVFESEGTL